MGIGGAFGGQNRLKIGGTARQEFRSHCFEYIELNFSDHRRDIYQRVARDVHCKQVMIDDGSGSQAGRTVVSRGQF